MSDHNDAPDLPDDFPREDIVLTAADHYRKGLWFLSVTPQTGDSFHEDYVENLLAANAHLQIAAIRAANFGESLAEVAWIAPDPDATGLVTVPPALRPRDE